MTLGEGVWFAPLGTGPSVPQSAWDPAAEERRINDAAAFTISLETVMVPKEHVERDVFAQLKSGAEHLLGGEQQILIASTCQVGSQPNVQRVHYYGGTGGFQHPFTSFVSETVYLNGDFHPPERINLLFQVAQAGTGEGDRQKIFGALTGIASKLGAIYPAILPYAFVGSALADPLNKLLETIAPSEQVRISQDVNLYPAGRLDSIDLQTGRYVLFDEDREADQYLVQPDGRLTTKDSTTRVTDFPYIIFRIDSGQTPTPEYVGSQRVATLLTQLNGNANDPFTSSLGFLSQTLDAYTSFNELERYTQLHQKQKSGQPLSADEQALMSRIGGRPELKDYLPQ
jgi:hypothetical protein